MCLLWQSSSWEPPIWSSQHQETLQTARGSFVRPSWPSLNHEAPSQNPIRDDILIFSFQFRLSNILDAYEGLRRRLETEAYFSFHCLVWINLKRRALNRSRSDTFCFLQTHQHKHTDTIMLCGLSKSNEGLKVVSRSGSTERHLPWTTLSLRPGLLVLSACICSANNLSDLIRPYQPAHL